MYDVPAINNRGACGTGWEEGSAFDPFTWFGSCQRRGLR